MIAIVTMGINVRLLLVTEPPESATEQIIFTRRTD